MQTLFAPHTRLRLAWFCVLTHICALSASLLVLVNGIPPGELSARREFVATHALSWGIGWLIWMPATLALILFYMAWADTLGYRAWALLAIGLTFAGGVVDWVDETIWIFLAPSWAMHAAAEPFYASLYTMWDRAYLVFSVGLANLLYTVAGIILNAIAFKTKNFPKWLAGWGALVWAFSLVLTYAGWANDELGIPLTMAPLFALFMPWLLLMGYGWLSGVQPCARDDLRERLSPREVLRSMIPKHPVPMTTTFRECFYVNFAVAADVLCQLLPHPLKPELYEGEAFVTVAIVQMEHMRPASTYFAAPKVLGVTYNQIVYRAVVCCNGERGVYFLRSDANHRLMSLLGDWLTFFRFHYARMNFRHEGHHLLFDLYAPRKDRADIHATFDLGSRSRMLPPSSKFKSLEEAQKFLVELYAAFAYDPLTEQVSTVRIERGEWDIHVIQDQLALYELMQSGALFPAGCARLDSIFYGQAIPYYWHRLK